MATLSISTAWTQTVAFVEREGRLLFPLAFMLVALPVALMEALTPAPPSPQEMPQPGLWLALFPLVLVATWIGNIAISALALRPGTSVGEAIRRGMKRFPTLFAAGLILFVAGAALLLVIAIVALLLVPGALSAPQAGVPAEAMTGVMAVMLFLVLPILLYFGARLFLLNPIAAAEDVGPIALLRRSWSLTAGKAWKLVAFLILVGIAVLALTTAIRVVAASLLTLAVARPEPGTLSALLLIIVMAAVNTLVTVYLTSLVARIYAQLSGAADTKAFD